MKADIRGGGRVSIAGAGATAAPVPAALTEDELLTLLEANGWTEYRTEGD